MIQIDMEMPKTCEECPLCHRAFDGNETRLACYRLGTYCFEDDGRLDNCPLHEVNTDPNTVSRQQAIDALEKVAELFPWRVPGNRDSYDRYNEAWNDAIGRAEIEIEELPSAQPERTCVNCGRTVNNGGWYADGRTRCPIEEHYALPKDGFCHLWEKRNVTDDDYPERMEE